jgi:uncharacterized damage-inducible protein DinB
VKAGFGYLWLGENSMTAELASYVASALSGELETLRDSVREVANSLSEQELWTKPIEPGNSVGHLILHLTGNLNHFVGAQLGGSEYVRDREREFTQTEVPIKSELLNALDEAVKAFKDVTSRLTPDQMTAAHPEARFGSVLQALVHLVAHFAIHRGQMTYIARMVKSETQGDLW